VERITIDTSNDVDAATDLIFLGHPVHVEVGVEAGPLGPEPKVELLRILLDRVQRRFAVKERTYIPHPSVESRYLSSCLIQPVPDHGDPAGSREPRRPRPGPLADSIALDPPLA
jgi:hypothetical protein